MSKGSTVLLEPHGTGRDIGEHHLVSHHTQHFYSQSTEEQGDRLSLGQLRNGESGYPLVNWGRGESQGFTWYFLNFIFICIFVNFHELIYTPCACRSPWRTEEGTRSPRTGITYGCEVIYECWEARSFLLSHYSPFVTWYFLQGGFD